MNTHTTTFPATYEEKLRLTRRALREINADSRAGKLRPKLRRFVLSDHERAVLQALEWLLEGRSDEFCSSALETAGGAAGKPAPVGRREFLRYRRKAKTGENVLRWALLLHDVAKDREDQGGAHALRCAEVARQALARIRREECGLSLTEKKLVVWLVAHHDVLGNIFTAERFPDHLLKITRGAKDFDRRINLLQVVMLCDLRGTLGGKFLSRDKAEFWLRLSNRRAVERQHAHRLSYRIKRWTGHVTGAPDPDKSRVLRRRLSLSEPSSSPAKSALEDRVTFVVDGFYLFTALTTGQLITLLERVTAAVAPIKRKEVTLVFDTKYKPPPPGETSAALVHYTNQLDRGELEIRVSGNEVHCV